MDPSQVEVDRQYSLQRKHRGQICLVFTSFCGWAPHALVGHRQILTKETQVLRLNNPGPVLHSVSVSTHLPINTKLGNTTKNTRTGQRL